MKTKNQRHFRKHATKVLLVIIVIFSLFIAGGYIWFVHNSKRILIDLFNERSQGKLKLQLADVTFNFINSTVKIREAKITSTDKNEPPISYKVSFTKITLHTNTIWSLLARRSLEIRQIKVFDPTIDVYNNLKNNDDTVTQLSIKAELGKLYSSIQEGISALHTHSIYINNAKLILHNKEAPDKKPIVFSNIYFTLKKLDKFNGKYFQNNNLDFSSSDQDILLSDGVHKLSFKKLSIKDARNIILDSCTIIALPTPLSGNNYKISFEKLVLTGVDFASLYNKSIIRADSVYCQNPISVISLNSGIPDSNIVTKGLPDLEKVIKNLSGNLDFGFVGLTNADIHLDIKGKKSLSNFHSGKVNLEFTNLRINPDSAKIISMKNFNMLVKGYHLYNADSSCIYSFDSIRFADDKLLLNNFSMHTTSGKNKIRSYRDYSTPFFELLGINWSELIFSQNLKASAAILHDPVINYRKYKTVEISKKSLLFNSHHSLDDFMDIEKLKIINGTINLEWGINNSLELTGLDLDLFGNNITDYKHVNFNDNIQTLYFTNGYVNIGDITAELQNVTFNEDNQVLAKELLVQNNRTGFDSRISNVLIKQITSDPSNERLLVDGIKWDKGTIKLRAIPGHKTKRKASSILLQNIEGRQTQFQITKNEKNASAFIDDLQIAYLLKNSGQSFVMKGLFLNGETVSISNASVQVKAEKFNLTDNTQKFEKVTLEKNSSAQNPVITTSSLKLTGNLYNYFNNNLHFKNVDLQSPEIIFKKENSSPTLPKDSTKIPRIIVDHFNIHQPALNVHLKDSTSDRNFLLPYSKANEITLDGLVLNSDKITVGNINLKFAGIDIHNGDDKRLKIDKGIDADIKNITLSNFKKQLSWEGMLTKLNIKKSDGFSFNLNENKLHLADINVGNVRLNSDSINNPVKLLTANPDAWITTSSAKYVTGNSLWNGTNITYNGSSKELNIDSIHYRPKLSRDSAIASNPYQMDYIYFSSGKALLNGFDLAKLFNDNSLAIEEATFTHPSIHIYRDKLPPFRYGIRKKLFTEAIKKIDLPISLNEIHVNDGTVSYTEKNAKSRLNGTFTLTHLNGNISNVKNNELENRDSLLINMTGKLQDKASFELSLHESYKDSFYGFAMNLQLAPTPLDILNPLLAPLSDVKFITGYLNSFKMHAVGNENFAHGAMKFYYSNMHIKLLKNGGTEKTRLLKSTESNLVNFFFVRNNNDSRTGLIYFERLKDYSFFNYMKKIVFSGISTSVGARKNRSYRKHYKQNGITNFE